MFMPLDNIMPKEASAAAFITAVKDKLDFALKAYAHTLTTKDFGENDELKFTFTAINGQSANAVLEDAEFPQTK